MRKKDLNAFFARLQAQDDRVAAWSEATIGKIKGVLLRMLVETEYLDNIRGTTLHPVFLYEELERGIRENMEKQKADDPELPPMSLLYPFFQHLTVSDRGRSFGNNHAITKPD